MGGNIEREKKGGGYFIVEGHGRRKTGRRRNERTREQGTGTRGGGKIGGSGEEESQRGRC